MTTPEGKIKKKIDTMLKSKGVWYFKPQAGQYGRSGVPDYIVCARGLFIGIEAKADKTKKPTALQMQCMEKIVSGGGKCFVVYDDNTLSGAENCIDDIITAATQHALYGTGISAIEKAIEAAKFTRELAVEMDKDVSA
jgi:hypothetical protein